MSTAEVFSSPRSLIKTICDLPGDVHNAIISYLGIRDRLNLRVTCTTMDEAVASSDFYVSVDQSTISFDVRVRMARENRGRDLVRRILLTVIFDDNAKFYGALDSFDRLVAIRKRLFKRAFSRRIIVDLKNVHNETMNIVESLLEGCVFKELKYAFHEKRPNDNLRQFFSNLPTVNITLSIHGAFVDVPLLLWFTRPIHIHWQSSTSQAQDLGWEIDDDLLIELNKRGHSIHLLPVTVKSADTILTILKIIASSVHHQILDVDILRDVYDEFLSLHSIRRAEHGYDGSTIILCYEDRKQLKFQDALLTEYDRPDCYRNKTSILISNNRIPSSI